MAIMMKASYSATFMDQKEAYILKAAWTEGLMMLRAQRRYNRRVIVSGERIIGEEDEENGILENEAAPETDNPETAQMIADENNLLSLAIASLPEKSRQVCQLLYAGQKKSDIAKALGFSSPSTVTYHIERIQEVFTSFGVSPA